MIPKVIHYCWFGGNPLPEEAQKCIASWKRYFPDFEIKRWDESNFDVNCCAYTREAYEAKKWAFVSDYARFWILYREGGIYFDTDVEVIKDFTPILAQGAFMGCEAAAVANGSFMELGVAAGLGIGASSGLDIYKEILNYYQEQHFLVGDNDSDPETVVGKVTRILKSRGYDPRVEGIQQIGEITVYPPEYFCPMDCATGELRITDNTYSIHHYAATWVEEYQRKELIIRYALCKWVGYSAASLVGRMYTLPFRVMEKYRKLKLTGTICFALAKLKEMVLRKK